MYATHVPLLTRHGQTPQGFANLVRFAIATEHQHFSRVVSILDHIRTRGLASETRLTERQKASMSYITQHATACLPPQKGTGIVVADVHDVLRSLVELPSIGIVKAGFIAQMLGYPVGCLDVHNCRALGLSPKIFTRVPTNAETLTCKVQMYVAACDVLGTAETMWDGWCAHITLLYPRYFPTAEDVSAYHIRCVTGEDAP